MSMLVDVIMGQTLGEIDISEDLILALSCGHALTMTSLDGMMEMNDYYENETDLRTGVVTYTGKKPLAGIEIGQVACHLCRKPISGLYRYGRRVKVAQLTERSKKFHLKQAKAMNNAQQAFDVARARVEENEAKLHLTLTKYTPEPRSEPPEASLRQIGKTPGDQLLPMSNFMNISQVYQIPTEQEDIWKNIMDPVQLSMKKFTDINKEALKSPSKKLFDAAVSHLYRIKAAPTFDVTSDEVTQPLLPTPSATASDIVNACILECGLPRDGHSGSSFVDSLQERINVLIFVVSKVTSAISRMDASNAGSGTNSGWYWLSEDLISCCMVHAEMLLEASLKGKRERTAAFAHMIRMDLILKTTQLVGSKPMPSEEEAQAQRLARADELMGQFMMEHQAIKDDCPIGIKPESLEKALALEKKMKTAIRIARGLSLYEPLSQEEKVELIRAVEQHLHGSGRWYLCPNGHPYVIGECGMAMEGSICPECGARVGGGDHTLLSTNTVNNEFEALRGR
ncbi:hypothetical protein BGX27_009207 [Mortierella sp. AM989]|nr:hypothetical protein BGX27_009207 [Mortierella sp. AM989]